MKNDKTPTKLTTTIKPTVAKPQKLTRLTVRTGVKAGLALAGCSPCHKPS